MSDSAIREFIELTSGNRAQALQYLEKAAGNAKVAASLFRKDQAIFTDPSKANEYFAGSGQAVCEETPLFGAGFAPTFPTPTVPPQAAPPPQTFTGQSRSLGGAAPPPAAQAAAGKTDYTTPGAPKTRVRLQLPSGTVVAIAVNLNATVGDLREYAAAHAGAPVGLTVEGSGKVLDDDGATVQDLGLKMATLRCTV
jgi:hypothetical protein